MAEEQTTAGEAVGGKPAAAAEKLEAPQSEKPAPGWIGYFLAGLVAYVVIGPSLGLFVSDYLQNANRIFDMAFGALLTLFVSSGASSLKK